MNPNNCKTCDYMKINWNREGHCYMFRDEPSDVCSQYTSRNNPLCAFGDALADAMEDMPELRDALAYLQGELAKLTALQDNIDSGSPASSEEVPPSSPVA